jgi:glycosyltransferase involved in cell wall biosynthesis
MTILRENMQGYITRKNLPSSKLALITPQFIYHPQTGFELRLYQLQVILNRIAGENLVTWVLGSSQNAKSSFVRQQDQAPLLKRMLEISRTLAAIVLHLSPNFSVKRVSHLDRERILRWINKEDIDIVILVHPYNSDLIPDLKSRGMKVYVDCHNVESDNISQMIKFEKSRVGLLQLILQGLIYRRWEQRLFPLADEIWLPSEIDCEKQSVICEDLIRVRCVPNALDINSYNPCQLRRSSDIVFPGSFGYAPNMEAARILSDRVLPNIRKSVPDARLVLVGRDSEGKARTLQRPNEIIVTGEVRDTKPHLCRAAVVAVPILHGSGTRFKILEALALGLPVVTTPLGCQGLAVEDSQHLLIRPVEHFAEAILFLLKDPDWASELGKSGRKLIQMKYSWDCVESQLRAALNLASIPYETTSA